MSHQCSSPYSFEMVSTQFLFCVNIQFDSSKQNGRNINPPAKRFQMEMNTHEKYSYENIYMCCFVYWKCSFACVYSHRFEFVHNEECDNKQHVLLYSLVQTFLALFLTRPLRVEWNSISSSLFYINFHWFFRFSETNSVFSTDPCKYLSDWFPVYIAYVYIRKSHCCSSNRQKKLFKWFELTKPVDHNCLHFWHYSNGPMAQHVRNKIIETTHESYI